MSDLRPDRATSGDFFLRQFGAPFRHFKRRLDEERAMKTRLAFIFHEAAISGFDNALRVLSMFISVTCEA